jgi:integrase
MELVSKSTKSDKQIIGNGLGLNNLIDTKLGLVWGSIGEDEVLQDKVSTRVVESLCVEEVKHSYIRSKVDVMEELDCFLDRRYSKITSNNYKRWIQYFLDWCTGLGIDCLSISPQEVDTYLVELMNKYESTNTVRSMVLGVSSFYSFMSIRHPEVFKVNPFHKVRLPKIKLTRRVDVVKDGDIEVVIKELNKIERPEIALCVKLMSKYGFRVGAFEGMTINDKGVYTSISKCSSITGKFTRGEVKEINSLGICGLKGNTISLVVKRITDKLFKNGLISCPFSCHDLRHYCITRGIQDMDCGKLVTFSRQFHKNINTTIGYYNG